MRIVTSQKIVYGLEIPIYSSFFKERKLQMKLKIKLKQQKANKMINSNDSEVEDNSIGLDTIDMKNKQKKISTQISRRDT
jgi:hypothetical protein